MKRVIDITEALGVVATQHGPREVCATGDARYEESKHQLVMDLTSFLRPTDLVAPEYHTTARWMPTPESLRESVDPVDATALAREIFFRWVRRVRAAAPPIHQHT